MKIAPRISAALSLLLVVLVGSCSSSSGSGCGTVGGKMLATLGIERASFVSSSDRLGNGRPAFYMAGPGGALWVTSADPSKDEAGLVLPVNAEAKAASTVGADAQDPTAPVFGTVSVTSKDAVRAKACSAG